MNRSLQLRRQRQPRPSGFTLMEVLLVLVILVILGSFAVGMFTSTQRKSLIKAATIQVRAFDTPIGEYYLETNEFPPDLQALRSPPANLANPAKWGGPYLATEIPLDPWSHPYQYVFPGRYRPESYDNWSLGPDGADGTEDDIGNWQ
jgi:general secretion pathway protein G